LRQFCDSVAWLRGWRSLQRLSGWCRQSCQTGPTTGRTSPRCAIVDGAPALWEPALLTVFPPGACLLGTPRSPGRLPGRNINSEAAPNKREPLSHGTVYLSVGGANCGGGARHCRPPAGGRPLRQGRLSCALRRRPDPASLSVLKHYDYGGLVMLGLPATPRENNLINPLPWWGPGDDGKCGLRGGADG